MCTYSPTGNGSVRRVNRDSNVWSQKLTQRCLCMSHRYCATCYTHTHIHTPAHMHTHTHTRQHTHTHTPAHTHTHMHTRTHTHTHARTCTHTHTHTQLHSHTDTHDCHPIRAMGFFQNPGTKILSVFAALCIVLCDEKMCAIVFESRAFLC